MRILQVIETGGPGGAETVVVELSDALRQRGHETHAIVGGEGWLAATLRSRGVPVSMHRSRRALDADTIRFLTGAIRRERIDVVHAHLFSGALYAGVAGALTRTPVVITLHGHADIKDSGARMRIKRWVLRHTAARAVFVSHTLERDLAPALRLPSGQTAVISNGVRVGTRVERDARSSAADAPQLVAVGNIRQPKGYPVLLDAVQLLRAEFPNVRLRIAGQSDKGPIMAGLEAQVARLGLERHVEFLGFVSDPSALLREADCFVLASYREGFSIATIEAMLAGTPVVSTRSGGPEEILTDGETGVLVPPSDPAALAAGIAGVLRDRPRTAAMVARAYDSAASRYGLSAMVDAYEELFTRVA